MLMLPPPVTAHDAVDATLADQGYAVLDAAWADRVLQAPTHGFQAWRGFWEALPADAYLKDGGRYRRRRHSCFVVEGEQVRQVPHRPHWQPVAYNALHGGFERHFEPMDAAMAGDPLWARWLVALGQRVSALKGAQPWFVEAHVFRIDTTDGIGRPTPEGAHRDGVDLVAVTLMGRHGIKGGETRVFEAQGCSGLRFTLTEPGSTLLLDDERVIHESTPIQPLDPEQGGHRDTLVLTFRAAGFQGPEPL